MRKPPHPLTHSLIFPVTVLMLAIAAPALTGCAVFSRQESAGEYLDDATLTTKVKSAILADPDLKVMQINVETFQGTVQLSGFVDSQQSKVKAVEMARRIKGVRAVKDDLNVREPRQEWQR